MNTVPSRLSCLHGMQWLGLVMTTLACIAGFNGAEYGEYDIRALILGAGPILVLFCWDGDAWRQRKNAIQLQAHP